MAIQWVSCGREWATLQESPSYSHHEDLFFLTNLNGFMLLGCWGEGERQSTGSPCHWQVWITHSLYRSGEHSPRLEPVLGICLLLRSDRELICARAGSIFCSWSSLTVGWVQLCCHCCSCYLLPCPSLPSDLEESMEQGPLSHNRSPLWTSEGFLLWEKGRIGGTGSRQSPLWPPPITNSPLRHGSLALQDFTL